MENMTTHRVGIIMNGVTGRMGANQHLLRSIVPIIQQGGVKLGPSETIMPIRYTYPSSGSPSQSK